MAREPKIYVKFPATVAAFIHSERPDDRGPEGAAWKPDNKYKVTLVYDTVDTLGSIKATMLAAAHAKWPGLTDDDFALPINERGEDDAKEGLRGKTTVKASSKFPPKTVDGRVAGNPVMGSAWAHSEEHGVDTVAGMDFKAVIHSGDVMQISASLYLYEKLEEISEKIGGKVVKTKVTTRGVSLQLAGIRLTEKRASASSDEWDDDGAAPVAQVTKRAPMAADTDNGDF